MATRISVNLGSRSYDILLGSGVVHELASMLATLAPTSVVVVTDDNVHRLHAQGTSARLNARVVSVPPGEASKSAQTLNELYTSLLTPRDLDRQSVIVALGGGVIGDLAGFAAATLFRGVRWICVPTTLLAMVDSAIGGKTAINRPEGKNLVGAFHQPAGVLCDTDLLATLPDREYTSALAEVVKTAVIGDMHLLAHLEAHADAILKREPRFLLPAIEACIRFKAKVVAQDEHDSSGLRATLNFGHTLAHALEGLYPGRWLHGEAVAIGICGALRCSVRHAGLALESVDRVRELLRRFGLPVSPPAELSADSLARAILADKKRQASQVRMIVLPALGRAESLSFTPDAQLASTLLGLADE